MRLRDAIDSHPLLAKYKHCLSTAELIPAEFRPSAIDAPLRMGLASMSKAWETDEFVLEPSRISLYIGLTGIDGATFKREQLMDKFGIQVNKTSRNTVLFMTNIGTTRSSVAYLIEVLVKIVRDLEEGLTEMSPTQQAAHARTVRKETAPCAPLPDFTGFHRAFLDHAGAGDHPTREGDVRRAYFLSYDDTRCEYLQADEVGQRMEAPAHGLGHLRHALPTRVPGTRPRPAVQPGDPGVHAQPGHPRGARLRPAGRLPRLHQQGARDRSGRALTIPAAGTTRYPSPPTAGWRQVLY